MADSSERYHSLVVVCLLGDGESGDGLLVRCVHECLRTHLTLVKIGLTTISLCMTKSLTPELKQTLQILQKIWDRHVKSSSFSFL